VHAADVAINTSACRSSSLLQLQVELIGAQLTSWFEDMHAKVLQSLGASIICSALTADHIQLL